MSDNPITPQAQAVKNLRLEMHPYPHLRDDDGCVLANDYVDDAKVAFILAAANSASLPPAPGESA